MELNVRLIERPLRESSLRMQTQELQKPTSLRRAEISETGIEMVSAIVGRRLAPSFKRVLSSALSETINGQLESGGIGGDLLAEVYGEIFGPLFTCLERGGDYTIIRLAVPKGKGRQSKMADFLLLDQGNDRIMLLEAKGHCSDHEAVRQNPNTLDICRKLRKMRNEGRNQLLWPTPDLLTDRFVHVPALEDRRTFPVPATEECVVATVIPDGRLSSANFPIIPPPHANCANPCTSCLHQPGNNLITVLSSQDLGGDGFMRSGAKEFLDWCKASERAVWGRAHGSFGIAFASLLSAWNNLEIPSDTRRLSVPFLTEIAHEAIQQNVYVDFGPVWDMVGQIQAPDNLHHLLQNLQSHQGDAPRPHVSEGSPEQIGRLIFGSESGTSASAAPAGNWHVLLRAPGEKPDLIPCEIHIRPPKSGMLELSIVPQKRNDQSVVKHLCWGLAEIIAAGRFPTGAVYDYFTDEIVKWRRPEQEEPSRYLLGRSLGGLWWPMWPHAIDPRLLDKMHRCCPACDEFAHLVERWPFFPRFFWRHDHRRPPSWTTFGYSYGATAFVTTDGRAVLRIPYATR